MCTGLSFPHQPEIYMAAIKIHELFNDNNVILFIQVLYEMFPDRDRPLIHKLLSENKSVEEVAEFFLSNPVFSCPLKKLASKIINDDEETYLEMNRNCLWNKAKLFYKKATTDVEILKKNLIISFSGEEGVDGGALKNEFFVSALKKMDEDFFEGNKERRLPKCHWGCEVEQVIAGALVSHSLLLGGPGFPCLHPAVYSNICSNGESEAYQPSIEDVPINSATIHVLDLIKQVKMGNTHTHTHTPRSSLV